jgi:hypothetical protein
LSIKNIPTGPGDTFNIQAAYASGASRYVFHSLATQNYAMYGGTGIPGVYQSLAFAATGDAVFAGTAAGTPGATSLQLTDTYGIRGGFNHNWDPYWASSISGAYAVTRYNGTAKGLICANFALVATLGATCNPDFNLWQIGTRTIWTPVKNFAISGEIVYSNLDQKYSGVVLLPPIATKPGAFYELKDQSTWAFLARVQRNW